MLWSNTSTSPILFDDLSITPLETSPPAGAYIQTFATTAVAISRRAG